MKLFTHTQFFVCNALRIHKKQNTNNIFKLKKYIKYILLCMSPFLPQPHNIYIVLYKIYIHIYIKNDIIYNKIPCNRSKYSIKSRNLRCALSEKTNHK